MSPQRLREIERVIATYGNDSDEWAGLAGWLVQMQNETCGERNRETKTKTRRRKMQITLTNDFHNTSVNIRCKVLSHIHNVATAYPNAEQIKKAKRTLCGVAGCCCSNDAGIRGRQETSYGKRMEVNLDAIYAVKKPTPVAIG